MVRWLEMQTAILVQSMDVIHWLWFCLLENNRKHCYQGVYFSQALAYCKKQAYLNINFKICRYGWANIGIDPKNCWRTFGAIIHHLTCICYWHFQSVRNAHFLFVGILLGNKVFDICVCWSILFWSGPTQTLPSINKMDSDTLFMLDFTQNIPPPAIGPDVLQGQWRPIKPNPVFTAIFLQVSDTNYFYLNYKSFMFSVLI